MGQKIIFDGRNLYDPEEVTEFGFEYHGIGREIFLNPNCSEKQTGSLKKQ